MAYFVSNTGDVFIFSLGENNTIVLSNGAVLPDPPPGQLFATQESAEKYAELICSLGSVEEAKIAHRQWVKLIGEAGLFPVAGRLHVQECAGCGGSATLCREGWHCDDCGWTWRDEEDLP